MMGGNPSVAKCCAIHSKTFLSSQLGRVEYPSGWECHSPTYSRVRAVSREISAIHLPRSFEPRTNAVGRSTLSAGAPVTSTMYSNWRLRSQQPTSAPPVSPGNFSVRSQRILSTTASSHTTVQLFKGDRNTLLGVAAIDKTERS